jgi:16S rRNA (adenine1518-N6/adenine1519-N6)-dimethyltransferase
VERIVRRAAVGPGDRVVEIGAGTGTLTRALAATGATVVAYEIDRALEPVLAETLAGSTAEVRFEDAAKTDLVAALPGGPWALVANLPYHVGTPLLLEILRHVPQVTTMVVMVQREVADRLTAAPGSRVYGLPSVVAQLHAAVRFEFPVAASVFVPEPAVASAVVSLTRVPAPAAAERAVELAAAAFNQRRKMLRRSMRGVLDEPDRVLQETGIDPTARAEDLAPDDFVRIAAAGQGT